MPYLSKAQIEHIAARVVKAYWRSLPQDSGRERRIRPEILAQKLLGLTAEYRSLSRDGSILGLTAFEGIDVRVYEDNAPVYYSLDGKTILMDSSLVREGANAGRRNFTLTHEACHQIYRMLFPSEYLPPAQYRKIYCCTAAMSDCRTGPVDWEEWRVNRLASAILMPRDLLMEQMRAAGLRDRIRLLNRAFAPREYEVFTAVAEAMGVSKAALAIRMKQLGLLDRDDLKDPYALVRVECDEE